MEGSKKATSFLSEIISTPAGEGVRLCIQCGTCSGSCPQAERMQHTPAQIIAMIRAGLRNEVLSSDAMWHCLSCYQCTVRCPRGVQITDLMHTLEGMALRERLNNQASLTPEMYRSFNSFVYSNGRLPEFSFMRKFYLSTNPFRAVGMLPVALSLLKHGRLSVKSETLSPEGRAQLKAILDKAESLGGAA